MTMTQNRLPRDFGLNSFQELIYQPPEMAGDHLDDLDAFRAALIEDLTPIAPTSLSWPKTSSCLSGISHKS